ncbi:hypothetical protein DFJ74DRAFT_671968 [Hyaloraphidium curvatum]|nr:hypothetical protein DFJ74DRAFT_671968 [Hyaloraphidium curvatum]
MVQLTMIPAKSNDTLREEELSELPTRVFSPKSGKPPVPRRASAPDARLPPALSSATLSDPTDPTAGPDPRPSLSPSARPSLSSRRAPSPAPTVGTLNVPSCPICLEPFEDGDELRTLRCGHELHTSCVDPWLLGRSGRCPVCRGDNRNPDAAPPPEAPEVAEPPAAVQAPVPAPQGRRGLGAVWAAIEAEAEWVRRSARVHRERRQREREAENAGGEAPQREEAAVPAGEAQA